MGAGGGVVAGSLWATVVEVVEEVEVVANTVVEGAIVERIFVFVVDRFADTVREVETVVVGRHVISLTVEAGITMVTGSLRFA